MMDKSIKTSVVESYGKLAKLSQSNIISKLFACCDPSANAYEVGKKIGYSEELLKSVPRNSNLGIGCGNPSALANITAGETVVDLGSGAGFDAFIVSRIVGENGKVIGVDLSDDMLKLANKNKNKANYTNTSFIKGDIEDLPIASHTAEHVISNCVINLSLNKGDVFKEAYRVLKPNGRLSISDIVLKAALPDYIKKSLAGHIACVSGAEKVVDYIQYIKDAGFEDITIESKSEFPLELMLTDPQIQKLAQEVNLELDGEEAKDLASRVISISVTATKPSL